MSDLFSGLSEASESLPIGALPGQQFQTDPLKYLTPLLPSHGLINPSGEPISDGGAIDPVLPTAGQGFGRAQTPGRTARRPRNDTTVGDGGLTGSGTSLGDGAIDPLTGDTPPVPDSPPLPSLPVSTTSPTSSPEVARLEFTSGVFTAIGSTLSAEYNWDGGGYNTTQLGVFALDGMELLSGDAFHREAARRASSNSLDGHLLVDDRTEGAKFSGKLANEDNFNQGSFAGVKTFTVKPGAKYGLILIPDGTLADIAAGASTGGSRRPLYSMATANPDGLFQAGQLVEAGTSATRGNTYIFEDLRLDQGSDRDYNDLVVRLRGVSGTVDSIDQHIDPQKDWRKEEAGKLLLADALPYTTVEVPQPANPGTSGAIDPLTGTPGSPTAPSNPVNPITPSPVAPIEPPTTQPATVPATSPLGSFPSTYPTPADIAAAAITPASKFPIIGVIDTGFARSNPDLDYSKIVWGKDYIDNDADPLLNPGEGNEHGTHILGLISAIRNNGVGIDGLAPDAPIWAARAVGSGNWAKALVDYVDYIKTQGQTRGLVNLSFDLTQKNADGTISTRYEFTPEERVAIEQARQAGVVLLVAAGNSGTGDMSVLAQAAQEFDNIISVAAAEQIDRSVAIADGAAKTDYSSSGKKLTISAIGGTIEQGIPSLLAEGLGTMAGTSVATAKVTANAALAWAANPSLNYLQLKDALAKTATDIEAPGYDELTGYGIVNGAAAVSLAKMTKGETYKPEPWFAPDSWGGEGFATPWEREVAAFNSYPIINTKRGDYTDGYLADAKWYQMPNSVINRDDVFYSFMGRSHATFNNFLSLLPSIIDNNSRAMPVTSHAGVPYKWSSKAPSTLRAELGREPNWDDVVQLARPGFSSSQDGYTQFRDFIIRQNIARPLGTQTGLISGAGMLYIPQPWTELSNFATLLPDTVGLANSAYAKNGGSSKLGSPTFGQGLGKFELQGYIDTPSLNVKYQVLSGGSEGAGALVLNRNEDQAFWIRGDVWNNTYTPFATNFGLPTSDRYAFGSGERQDFEKGAIFYTGPNFFILGRKEGEFYQRNLTSTQRNQLGMMTGNQISSRDGLTYPFSGGNLKYSYSSGLFSVELNWSNYPLVATNNWTGTGSVRLQNPPQPGTTAGLPNTAGAYQYSTRSANGAIAHYYANGNLQQQPNKTTTYWYQVPGATQSSSTSPATTPVSTKLTSASQLFDQTVIVFDGEPAPLNAYSSLKQGNLSNSNPDDLFYFDVTKPGEYVQWSTKTLSGKLRMQIIRDANNNGLLDSGETVYNGSLGLNSNQSMTFDEKGRYYVRLFPGSGGLANYQLNAVGSPYRPLHHGADFNRDGLTDLVRQEKGAISYDDIRTGEVFTYGASSSSLIGKFTDLPNDIRGSHVNLIWGDFNGDRRPDYIRQEKADWATWNDSNKDRNTELWLAGADGKGFYKERDLDAATGSGFNGNFVNLIPGDFNGDGKTDFIRQEKGSWDNDDNYTAEVWLNAGAANFRMAHSLTFGGDGFKGDYVNIIPGDFDGDGRTDFIRQEKNTWDDDGSNTAVVFLSNGDGQFRPGIVLNNSDNDLRGDFTNLIPGDFNGDGQTDFIRQEKNTLDDDEARTAEVWLSSGGRSQFTLVPTPLRHDGDDFKGNFVNIIPGDFNGDGRTDIIRQEFGPRSQSDEIRTAEVFLSSGDGTFSKYPQLIRYEGDDFKGTFTNILTGAPGGTAPFYEHTESGSDWVVEYHGWPSNRPKPVDLGWDRDDVLGSTRLGSNIRSDGKRGFKMDWGSDAPDARVPNDQFAMRAYTQYSFEAGKTYVARVRADDGYRLFAKHIGTNEWVNFMPDGFREDAYGAHKEIRFTVPKSGTYDFHFEFYDSALNAYFDLTIDEAAGGSSGGGSSGTGVTPATSQLIQKYDAVYSNMPPQAGHTGAVFTGSNYIALKSSPEFAELWNKLFTTSEIPNSDGGYLDHYAFIASGSPQNNKYHAGIDFRVPLGTPVKALVGGEVIYVGTLDGKKTSSQNPMYSGEWGTIAIYNDQLKKTFMYLHMDTSSFSEGDFVNPETVIGLSGSTGSSASHLHLEVKPSPSKPSGSSVKGLLPQDRTDWQKVMELTDNPLIAYLEARDLGLTSQNSGNPLPSGNIPSIVPAKRAVSGGGVVGSSVKGEFVRDIFDSVNRGVITQDVGLFLTSILATESGGGDWQANNGLGYLGAFQMGPGERSKYAPGVSNQDFLSSKDIQMKAAQGLYREKLAIISGKASTGELHLWTTEPDGQPLDEHFSGKSDLYKAAYAWLTLAGADGNRVYSKDYAQAAQETATLVKQTLGLP